MSPRMKRQTRPPSVASKASVTSQTVIPRKVRERLRLKPGDTLRYRLTAESVLLDKAPASVCGDPFAVFSEWSGEADEKAYDGPPAAPPRRLALWSVLGELRLMLSGYRSHL